MLYTRVWRRKADVQGYMSPEIINGLQFDLPTDVFSLGIIFIEILSRKLVDSRTYTVRISSLAATTR